MEEVDEAIAEFCAVTGADDATARHFLAAAEGNLDAAVSLFLDGGSAGLSGARESEGSTVEEVRAPIKPKRSVLVNDEDDDGYDSFTYPRVPPAAFAPVVEPFRDFRIEASSAGNMPFASAAASEDERGRRLAALFRPPTEIIFVGTLDAARRHAREQGRWLLVTLHCPSEFPCQMMIRDVWNEQAVQEFIRESLVFFFLTMSTSEAERYRQYYPVEEFPHWALIDPRTGKRVKQGSRVMKGPEMLMELVDFVADHPLPSPAGTSRGPAKRESPILEEEGVVNRSAVVDVEADEGEASSASSASKMAKKSPTLRELPPEPSLEQPEALTVQLRMPDGSRHRRRFLRGDLVQSIFDYAINIDGALEEETMDIVTSGMSLRTYRTSTVGELGLRNATLTVVRHADEK